MTDVFDQPLEPEQVGEALDFASPGIEAAIAEEQRLGTTAIYNILCEERVAYLADEVGMGKTYQALGVIALTWLLDPSARVLVITPRKAVQQKWSRDYKNFIATNVRIADNRLKDPVLGRAVHRRCFCENLIELGQELCRDPGQLFLSRLSSFSWVARSLGVLDSGEVSSGREIAESLRGDGLFVNPCQQAMKRTFEGSTEQNVEVARQMASLLPSFDLVVVDEAQKLRNKGSNIRTQVLNTLLGFYPWTEPEEFQRHQESVEPPPRLLLLSATPAHRSENDIYRQLSYASGEALEVPDRPWGQRQKYLGRVMVRRLRKLAGHSKYDYRREKPVIWDRDTSSPERVLDELFVAYVQRELQAALDRESVGARLEVGFLETFESYEPSDLDQPVGEHSEEGAEDDGSTRSTHYEAEDDTVAPDHGVLADVAHRFAAATGSSLPPHPKQRLVDDAARASFEADRPEKLLIFVRRLASVRELTRRICRIYDEVTLQRLSEQIGEERVRERVQPRFDFGSFETVEAFRIYADIVLGTELEEAEPKRDEKDESDDRDDDSVAQSEILELMGRRTHETTPGEKLLRRLQPDGSLASVFEENLVRFLYRRLQAREVFCGTYSEFCEEVCDNRVRSSFEAVLAEARTTASGSGSTHFFEGNGSTRFSRVRALLYELVLLRVGELYPEDGFARQLLRLHREVHGERHELRDELETEDSYARYIDDFLVHRSFWDLAAEREGSGRLPALLVGEGDHASENAEWLEYREFIKRIVEKNVRVSDAILHFFVAYDRAGGANAERVAEEFADIIFGGEGVRTRNRIQDLIEQGPALENLAAGRLSSDTPLYAETRWADFDRQQPALGAMGSTSSRYPVIVKFNAPFFPDFVVATDVFREGVDLHMSCRRVWHFGMVANPGDVEQRSGRIDRYFSKVHRALQRADGPTTEDPDGQVHIGYPYLARTIDEQQVSRVLERKLEVQPLMDQGLSVSEELRLKLDERSDEDARALLERLSNLTSEDTTPFPVDSHLKEAAPIEALAPEAHLTANELVEWLSGTLRQMEEAVPLIQPVAEAISVDESGRLRGLPALTNVAVRRDDESSVVIDPEDGELDHREQPVRIAIGFHPATRLHYLRLTTPLGDHGQSIAAGLQEALHTHYPTTPLRLNYRPEQSEKRRQWTVRLSTDVVIPATRAGRPTANDVKQRVVELAEVADDLEWRLRALAEIRQDLRYEEVRQ